MRVPRVVTLTTGVALGAGVMYLFDPEHGDERRRLARRRAIAQARQRAARAVHDGRERAQQLAVAAAAGYRESQAVDARESGL